MTLLQNYFITLQVESILIFSCNRTNVPDPQETENYDSKIRLAKKYCNTNPDLAIALIDSLKYILKTGNKVEISNYYSLKAYYHYRIDNIDSSLYYFSEVATKNTNDTISAKAYKNLSIVFSNLGEKDSAIKYCLKALNLNLKLKDTTKIIKTYYLLSNDYISKEMYQEALQYQLQAIQMLESAPDQIQLMKSNISLGVIYNSFDKYEEALNAYKKALQIAKNAKICDSTILPTIYNNISSIFKKNYNQIDSALFYVRKGRYIAPHNSQIRATLFVNMGLLLQRLGQYDSAFYYFKKSHEDNPELRFRRQYDNALSSMASILLIKNQYDSAYFYIDSAIKVAKRSESIKNLIFAYSTLATIDSSCGNYKSALKNRFLATKLSDSLHSSENIEKLESTKIKYETEKKDTELQYLNEQQENYKRTIHIQFYLIALGIILTLTFAIFFFIVRKSKRNIQIKNREIIEQQKAINIQNQKLNELIKTKDKFFSIISHDLRGPFHSQLGLLNMMVEDYKSFDDDEKFDIINSIQETTQNSFKLLNMLLEWSRAQIGKIECNPEIVNCYETIEKAIEFAVARAEEKHQTIQNTVDKNLTAYVDQKLINTIFNNLINNSIKFTPDGGTITINAEEKTDEVIFCVADTGIGMPQEKADKIFNIDSDFKRKGTSGEPSTGLGLILVKEFVALLKGKIWAESEENKGSRFYFSVPKNMK